MRLDYNLTRAEYYEACRLLTRSRSSSARSRVSEIVSLAGVAVGFVLLFGVPVVPRAVAAVLLIALSFFHLFYDRHRLHANYDSGWKEWEDLGQGATLDVTDSHLILCAPDCEIRFAWRSFTRMLETPYVFVLSREENWRAIIVAKRLLTVDQAAEFRATADREIPSPAVYGFPITPRGHEDPTKEPS